MIDVISLLKSINRQGDSLLAQSDAEATSEKPSQISVFNNYFETNSEKDADLFLQKLYGITDEN